MIVIRAEAATLENSDDLRTGSHLGRVHSGGGSSLGCGSGMESSGSPVSTGSAGAGAVGFFRVATALRAEVRRLRVCAAFVPAVRRFRVCAALAAVARRLRVCTALVAAARRLRFGAAFTPRGLLRWAICRPFNTHLLRLKHNHHPPAAATRAHKPAIQVRQRKVRSSVNVCATIPLGD